MVDLFNVWFEIQRVCISILLELNVGTIALIHLWVHRGHLLPCDHC